jgi:hypothetical protein
LTITTVELIAAAAPMNSASMSAQPSATPASTPSPIVIATCTGTPSSSPRPTDSSSRMLKRSPMLNMSSATPMSARARTSSRSATNPGVNGPTARPATM